MDIINKISKWGIPVTTLITFFCFIFGLFYHNGYCNWFGIKVSISELNFTSLLLINYYSLDFIFSSVCYCLLTTYFRNLHTEYKSLDKTFKPIKDISKEIPDMLKSFDYLKTLNPSDIASFFKNKDLMNIFVKITEIEGESLQYLKNKTTKETLSIPKSEFISVFGFPNDIINKCDDINYNILLNWLTFFKGTLTHKLANSEKYLPSKSEFIIGIAITISLISFSILIIKFKPHDSFELISALLGLMVGVLFSFLDKFKNPVLRLITLAFCISILLWHSYASGKHSAQYSAKPNISISTKSNRANKELFNIVLRTNRGYYLHNQKSDYKEILFIPDSEIISIRYLGRIGEREKELEELGSDLDYRIYLTRFATTRYFSQLLWHDPGESNIPMQCIILCQEVLLRERYFMPMKPIIDF